MSLCLLVFLFPGAALAGPDADCADPAVTLSLDWSRALHRTAQGVVVRLAYPEDLIVAKDDSGSAKRVVRRLGAAEGGLFDAVTHDTDGDGADDRLDIGLVTERITPGRFVEVRFACRPEATSPAESGFTCEPEVSDSLGAVEATCAVSLSRGDTKPRAAEPRAHGAANSGSYTAKICDGRTSYRATCR